MPNPQNPESTPGAQVSTSGTQAPKKPEPAPGAQVATNGTRMAITTQDGTSVVLDAPNVYLGVLINKISREWLGDGAPITIDPSTKLIVKCLLCVVSVRGETVTRPGDAVQARELANRIGDFNMDIVVNAWASKYLGGGASLPL